jgi:hypothetical protein
LGQPSEEKLIGKIIPAVRPCADLHWAIHFLFSKVQSDRKKGVENLSMNEKEKTKENYGLLAGAGWTSLGLVDSLSI